MVNYYLWPITGAKGSMDLSYERIFNCTDAFYGVLARDGTVRSANDTILEFTGSDREEVIGKKLWEISGIRFSEFAQRQVRTDVRHAANRETVKHELTIQGALRPALIELTLQPLTDEDGEVTHLLAGGHDITAVKQRRAVTPETNHGEAHTDLLVTYSRVADESVSEAIIQAFLALNIDIFEMDSTLQDWIDADLLDEFAWHSPTPPTITTCLWGYTVTLTADTVRIYSDSHA